MSEFQHLVTESVFRGLSDAMQVAIDTGNKEEGYALLSSARLATITTDHLRELTEDFNVAFEECEE